MKQKNKFSVLISVYHKEDKNNFEKALYSIVNQTLIPDEIVLVEDGKLTEELYDVIEKYKTKYNNLFQIVKLEKNMGLGYALNEGLKNCKYEYVARMDSDDYSVPTRFEKEMKTITQKNVDLVGSNIDEFDEKMENLISKRMVPENHEEIVKYAKKRNPINHVTVMFRKKSVISANGYIDCPYFEDYYLWVRMIMKGFKFYNIQESLVNVRGGLDMLKRRGGKNYNHSIINFNKKIYKTGFITKREYLYNIVIRIFVSIVPNFVRKFIYEKLLRNN